MKGILLVNLGTPDSTSVKDVRKYLHEFLMDERVIDIPVVSRWLLVNFIIAPFRGPKSAHEYQKLFTEKGSPLKYHGYSVRDKLQEKLGQGYKVALGMRYQNPAIASGLEELKHCKSILVIPLFPQYASATTGSVHSKVMEIVNTWQVIPEMKFISKFFEEKLFLQTLVNNAHRLMADDTYEHFVFSYHGIPERQIHKASLQGYCKLGDCCSVYDSHNTYCYRAQCYENSRLLADLLNINESQYTVCFQSRLGKDPWIQPYAEDVIELLAKKGVKKTLVFSPAFVADCLETTVEVGEAFRDNFLAQGGLKWTLVPSLNDNDMFVDCLANLVYSKNPH
jgi:protoporphyrin/coproporphyrin ferrochelatase